MASYTTPYFPRGRPHYCPWPGCTQVVNNQRFACTKHMAALPDELRAKLLAARVSGQEHNLQPNPRYMEVVHDIAALIGATPPAESEAPAKIRRAAAPASALEPGAEGAESEDAAGEAASPAYDTDADANFAEEDSSEDEFEEDAHPDKPKRKRAPTTKKPASRKRR